MRRLSVQGIYNPLTHAHAVKLLTSSMIGRHRSQSYQCQTQVPSLTLGMMMVSTFCDLLAAQQTPIATQHTVLPIFLCKIHLLHRHHNTFPSTFTTQCHISVILAVVVCSYIRPSHASIVSKSLNIGSRKQHLTIAQGL